MGDEKRGGPGLKQSPEDEAARKMPAPTPEESERAGTQRGAAKAGDVTAPHPTGASAPSPSRALPEEEPLLGAPPRIDEPERPAIGESSSQAWPGAVGPHANPIAGEEKASVGGPAAAAALPSGSRATTRPSASDDAASGVGGTRGSGSYGELPAGVEVLGPGEVLPPRPAPDMTATGAFEGPHPPAPPYEGEERRLAQRDWDRWRAEDRRKAPFSYPEWRT